MYTGVKYTFAYFPVAWRVVHRENGVSRQASWLRQRVSTKVRCKDFRPSIFSFCVVHRAEDSYDGTIVRCVEVDSNLMGLVVGKEARNLRAIADRTDTRVYARRFERNRIYIEGNSRESVDNAEIEIKRSAVGKSHVRIRKRASPNKIN